jgi:precorrin-6x reductase
MILSLRVHCLDGFCGTSPRSRLRLPITPAGLGFGNSLQRIRGLPYNTMSYSLRSTTRLDAELATRGARTTGSTVRKQERLQRFLAAEAAIAKVVTHPYNTRSKQNASSANKA